jgi:hypothetical protein
MLDPGNTLMAEIDVRKMRKAKPIGGMNMGMGVPMPSPVQFLGLTVVGDAGRPRSVLTPGGRSRAMDGSPDEVGLVRRASGYDDVSPPRTSGSSREEKEKEKERWANRAKPAQGIRSLTK